MPRPIRSALVSLAVITSISFLSAACQAGAAPTGPIPTSANLAIADGSLGKGLGGSPHFFWLPPTVPAVPTGTGTFDPTVQPTVTICLWTGAACAGQVAHFTTTEGTGGMKLAVNTVSPSYRVSWISSSCDTRALCPLDPAKSYRMFVTVPDASGNPVTLGYADIDVVRTALERIKVNKNEYVPLLPGSLLGIAFRIDRGYLAAP